MTFSFSNFIITACWRIPDAAGIKKCRKEDYFASVKATLRKSTDYLSLHHTCNQLDFLQITCDPNTVIFRGIWICLTRFQDERLIMMPVKICPYKVEYSDLLDSASLKITRTAREGRSDNVFANAAFFSARRVKLLCLNSLRR